MHEFFLVSWQRLTVHFCESKRNMHTKLIIICNSVWNNSSKEKKTCRHCARNKFQFVREEVLNISRICSRRLFVEIPHEIHTIWWHSMSLMRLDFGKFFFTKLAYYQGVSVKCTDERRLVWHHIAQHFLGNRSNTAMVPSTTWNRNSKKRVRTLFFELKIANSKILYLHIRCTKEHAEPHISTPLLRRFGSFKISLILIHL